MEKLIDALNQFQEEVKVVKDDTELSTIFKKLAPNFLYGGYIQVNKDYKVFIRTVDYCIPSQWERPRKCSILSSNDFERTCFWL